MYHPSSTRLTGLILMLAASALLSDAASAITLRPSTFEESLYGGSYLGMTGDSTTPETLEGTSLVPGYAHATGHAFTRGGSLPRVEGYINVTSDNDYFTLLGSAGGRIDYWWTVEQTGGEPFTGPVPIDVHTRGHVDSSSFLDAGANNLYAQAFIELDDADGPLVYTAQACADVCTPGPISFDARFSGTASVDEAYRVTLIAAASGWASGVGATFTLEAWADPRIEISPAFARRDDFRLVFGNGVTAVPEPGTAAMLGAGALALLGLARRRAGSSAHGARRAG